MKYRVIVPKHVKEEFRFKERAISRAEELAEDYPDVQVEALERSGDKASKTVIWTVKEATGSA